MTKPLLTVCILLLSIAGAAQQAFFLPTPQVIVDSGIAMIEVIQNEQPDLQGWQTLETDPSPNDPATQNRWFKFYFNDFGRVDSQLHSQGTAVREGTRIRYDEQHRIIEMTVSLTQRPQYRRYKMWPTADGWTYREWEDGKVIRTSTMTKDSVLVTDSLAAKQTLTIYNYDPKVEEYVTETYKGDKLCARTSQRWIMKDGKPDSVLLVSEFFNKELPRHYDFRENGKYEGKHKVFETGEVLTKPETPFTRTIGNLNYQNRLNKSRGITFYFDQRMILDSFENRGPTEYLHSFANTTSRSYISYVYHYR